MKIFFVFLSVLFSIQSFAQVDWQQEVNYKIKVQLNDVQHTLSGSSEFEYFNNSPSTLDFIYVHVWANAYKDGTTPLAKQLERGGKEILKFADDSIKGNVSGLDFKVNNQPVNWEFVAVDIIKINLANPLLPSKSLVISTPFNVKIPSGEISRLGHIGQSYQITQWYPKPAVFDKNGWNEMSYLNQGEFYSEYGSFDVEITLPGNYVVGATGNIMTPSEVVFLEKRAIATEQKFKTNSFDFSKITSSTTLKNIRYQQDRVHDFAWFADKSYEVLKGEVTLPHSKEKVTSWAMFTPENAKLWENAIEYLNDGTYYYSLWNGDYPYRNVTAVDGTISAGGGMEYPTITVIGNTGSKKDLEIVIVHEVGHNWFYGILGSNERKHGWMDEGLNTLNEIRYIQTKYPNNSYFSDNFFNSKFHFEDLNHHDNADISYLMLAHLGEDQPIETSSEQFSGINYGVTMYQKTGLIFFYLKAYLGDELFDVCMSKYFETWKFKHPQPEDLCALFEKESGKELKWMFEDLINTTNHIDYKIKNVRLKKEGLKTVVKNKGQVAGPIQLSFYSNSELIKKQWIEPIQCGSKIILLDSSLRNIDKVVIDTENNIPEINKSNNQWNKSWLVNRFEPLRFEFLAGDNDRDRSSNFWTPFIFGNQYDHTMLGLILHNYTIPSNRFQYLLTPMYSFSKNKIRGVGEFSYLLLPKKNIKLTRVGLSLKSFSNEDNFYLNDQTGFVNVSPYLFMKLGNRADYKNYDQIVQFQSSYNQIASSSSKFEEIGFFIKYKFRNETVNQKIAFEVRNDWMKNITSNDEFSRVSLKLEYKKPYYVHAKKYWVDVKSFIGFNYLYNESTTLGNRYQIGLGGMQGNQDVFYEDYFFARTSMIGKYSGQRTAAMGDFKNANLLNSSSWLGTITTFVELPFKPNIFGVFTDAGVMPVNQQTEFVFNTGIGVKIKDVFGIYFPLYNSTNLGDIYMNYASRIRFTLKLNIFNQGFRLPNL